MCFLRVFDAPDELSLPEGAVATIVDRNGDWLTLEHNGRKGWRSLCADSAIPLLTHCVVHRVVSAELH